MILTLDWVQFLFSFTVASNSFARDGVIRILLGTSIGLPSGFKEPAWVAAS
jgi:hypothetical protein